MAKTVYSCPMDPDVVSTKPGKCPKCGMELVPNSNLKIKSNKQGGGHRHHEGMEEEFKKRFFWSIPIAVSVLILSPQIQEWFGYTFVPPYRDIILFALATLMVFFMALPFYQMAKGEIRSKNYGMMTLVSLAVLSGYFFSVGATFFFPGESLYWEISTLVLAFLFGHWMEMRAVRGATGALSELAKLTPTTAHRIARGPAAPHPHQTSSLSLRALDEGSPSRVTPRLDIVEVSTEELNIGDLIMVRPGEKVPIDGIVEKGESSINESMITGESVPVAKKKGSEVIGGTINADGSLTVRVTKTGSETALAQMMELVEKAQETKPPVQRLADRAAKYLTFTAVTVGTLTFLFWTFGTTEGVIFAGTSAIAVIVIACPHALGLAIPTVTTITTSLAAKNGILIRDMKAIEVAKRLDYVIFDKTGTLTQGKFGVTKIVAMGSNNESRVLKIAASLEYHSQHPLAIAIVEEAKKRKIEFREAESFKSYSGKGAGGKISGKKALIGNGVLLSENKIKTQGFEKYVKEAGTGSTYIWVVYSGEIIGMIMLEDIIRPESKDSIAMLHRMGIKTAMLTGDLKEVADKVAKKLSVDTVYSQVLPEDKVEKVRELQKSNKIVAMVGDGVNDAAALTQANIGIAIGAGTGVAIEAAEIVLMKNDPRDVIRAIQLSKATGVKMVQNLFWAAGYNVLAIPAAAGVFFPFGIILRPEWSALIMSASSVIVVANAFLLRRVKLG